MVRRIGGMNNYLIVVDVKVEIKDDSILITHLPTGMCTHVAIKLLHKWLITMLRKAIPHA